MPTTKKSETALSKRIRFFGNADDKYRKLIEACDGLLVEVDSQGRFTYVNPGYCKLFGKRKEELLGQSFMPLVHADDQEITEKSMQQLTREPYTCYIEQRAMTVKGWRWIAWSDQAVLDKNGEITSIVGLGWDITRQKLIEDALRDSQRTLAVFLGNLPGMAYRSIHDRRRTMIFVSEGSQALTGYSPEEIVNFREVSYMELILPEHRERVRQTIEDAIRKGSSFQVDYVLLCAEGPSKWVLEQGQVSHSDTDDYLVEGFIIDVTERRITQKALEQSEMRFRSLVENASDEIFCITKDGVISYISPNVKRISGYTVEEVIGTRFVDYTHQENHREIVSFLERIFSKEKKPSIFTYRSVTKEGEWRWKSLNASIIKDAFLEPIILCISRDITERVQYEEQLKTLSLRDELTGVYNRTFFEAELKRIQGSREYPIAILSCDVDGLKIINDTLGHEEGDFHLKACADLLQGSLRSSDLLARVGGDEFVIILPRSDEGVAFNVMDRIKQSIFEYNEEQRFKVISISIGLAVAEDQDVPLKNVLHQADEKMYNEKMNSRRSYHHHFLNGFIDVLADKDGILEGHAMRVNHYCKMIAEKMNLSKEVQENLRLLSKLHDLGKVAISDEILQKKESLNAGEWEMVLLHPEKGYRIALSFPEVCQIAELILKHHERWDGRGYPAGLKGEEIPIECRVFALADSFDVMTTDKPYQKAKTREEAIHELRLCAGKQFDPKLTEAFLEILLVDHLESSKVK